MSDAVSLMERLPFVDEYAAKVPSSPERTWDALVRVLRSDLSGGGRLARVLGAFPSARSGDWSGDLTGATLPGFAVVEAQRPARLELRGHHRFSSYALVFLIDDGRVRAQTYAAFPGLRGRAYRALVIGTRAHRVLVRRLLRRIAGTASADL
jgi:hypothetical protein